MDHLITLIEALSDADDQPGAAELFLPTGVDWDLDTPCAILVVDPDGDEVPPPLARRYGLGSTLSIPQLQDILSNARQQVANVTSEQLFAAFRFYYDHDAFIDFAGGPDARPGDHARGDAARWRPGTGRGTVVRHVLFICEGNIHRSPTAADLYAAASGLEARSAGLVDSARVQLCPELIAWADLLFVMEARLARIVRRRFGADLATKELVCLDIPDDYQYMQAELCVILRARLAPHLGPPEVSPGT